MFSRILRLISALTDEPLSHFSPVAPLGAEGDTIVEIERIIALH